MQYQPLRGEVTGRNTGKKFLVRSLTGVGAILAATVGVQTGTGITDSFSNNVLLREQVANNVANAGQQQLNELAYHQNIVVTVPGNTRFYIVLANPRQRRWRRASGSAPAGNPCSASGYARLPPQRARTAGTDGTEAGTDPDVPAATEGPIAQTATDQQ